MVTVTATFEVPHGVVKVTVKMPRVLSFDVMVKRLEPPADIVADGGEIVRLLAAEAVTLPLMLPRTRSTPEEPPFLLIDIDVGVTDGAHPAGVGSGFGVGVGVGVGVLCGFPCGVGVGVAVGVGVGVGVGLVSSDTGSGVGVGL